MVFFTIPTFLRFKIRISNLMGFRAKIGKFLELFSKFIVFSEDAL
jgi:hypothetical protein